MSDDYKAQKYRQRLRMAGIEEEKEELSSEEIAASHAWEAGIEEGKRQAAQTLSELVTRGMPRVDLPFR